MELTGSSDCSIDRTFKYQFNFQTTAKSTSFFKKMIDSGEVKSQAELTRIKGISRARVTQILNLLKLDKNYINYLKQLGDPMDKKIISKRKLRKIINQFRYLVYTERNHLLRYRHQDIRNRIPGVTMINKMR